jgi:hypothetical protein
MAGTTGLEPATSAVTGQHSNQLNYVPTRQINHLREDRINIDDRELRLRASFAQKHHFAAYSGRTASKDGMRAVTRSSLAY